VAGVGWAVVDGLLPVAEASCRLPVQVAGAGTQKVKVGTQHLRHMFAR